MPIENQIVGEIKEISDIFANCSSQISRERIALLSELVAELPSISIIIIDSLCYQLSLLESDIDLELLIDKNNPDEIYQCFLQKITELFPKIKIQNFSESFYGLMEIRDDLLFLQNRPEATEEIFNQEQGHNLISIRDFYIAVKTGGMLIGLYPKEIMDKIEIIANNCPLLRKYTSDYLPNLVALEKKYFSQLKKSFYIDRLKNNLELFGVTSEQLIDISKKIDELIQ